MKAGLQMTPRQRVKYWSGNCYAIVSNLASDNAATSNIAASKAATSNDATGGQSSNLAASNSATANVAASKSRWQ